MLCGERSQRSNSLCHSAPKPYSLGNGTSFKEEHVALKLSTSMIFSEDLNNLLPFYRDVLGLPVRLEAPGFVQLGGADSLPVSLGTHSEVHGKAKEPARHIVSFETGDIKAEYARLKAAGVEFLEEPASPGGDAQVTFAAFKDPEGNYLQLVQFG
jgi:lactoylglutathione lyase